MEVRIATRTSKLALWQTHLVKQKLEEGGLQGRLIEVSTHGDESTDLPLHRLNTIGVFTKAIDAVLLEGKADLGVHSAKDMPSILPEDLTIVAFLKREDPRDVLLALSDEVQLDNYSRPLVIGTSSLRRRLFLEHYFHQVEVKDIRGNIDTRVAKLSDGAYDGIILAYAGVKRLGLQRFVVQKLNVNSFIPAVGQGAIAVVARKDYILADEIKNLLQHEETAYAIYAERAFLREVEGGCQTATFGFASVIGNLLTLKAGWMNPESMQIETAVGEGTIYDAERIGYQVAREVLLQRQ